ncbi:MAG TPA: hypothetical protein VK324_12775, partial [Tepidisphaeraceae bacterium]|nr:hypothetical protein [Tepidisphaeraceae bacterium]
MTMPARPKVATAPLLLLIAAGCNNLPRGDLPPARGTPPHVYLIRGWRDLYSGGIDRLAAQLREAGVDAAVYKEDQHADLAAALAARRPRPLVLIGFSYGADDAIAVARRAPVDLLVTVDPVTPP